MLKEKRFKIGLFLTLFLSVFLLSGCPKQAIVSGWASETETLIPTGNTCTNQNGGRVEINVPGPGTVTVTAQAMLGLKSHTTGKIDMMMLHIGSSATDCTLISPLEGFSHMGFSIPKDEPSWSAQTARLIPVAVSRSFTVNSAGSKTYYLNARNLSWGSGNAYIWSSSMQAVYYPD
jgi:hypothetical protein